MRISFLLLISLSFLAQAQSKCISDDLVLAATGDTIFHGALLVQAFKDDSVGDFTTLWADALPYLGQADLMYTNLEGPVAPGLYQNGKEDSSLAEVYHPTNKMYSIGEAGKSFTFNFHPESVRSLIEDGFTLFSTANNHTLDRRIKGLNKTLDFLDDNGVVHFGSKRENDSENKFVSIVYKNNISVAFVSCTYGTNKKIKTNQILKCFSEKSPNKLLLNLVEEFNRRADVVVVTPHWGSEYSEKPNSKQKKLSNALVNSGAKAIIGHHPHVIQSLEFIKNKNGYEVPVFYSLGNFVTNQVPTNWKDTVKNDLRFIRRVGATAFLGFSKVNNDVVVSSVKLMPTYMKIKREGKRGIRKLVPAYPELYPGQKKLVKSLKKANRHFSEKFNDKNILTYQNINTGIVCD